MKANLANRNPGPPAPQPWLRAHYFLVLALSLGWSSPAAQRQWDGGGLTADWTEAANWARTGAAAAGDDLVFPQGASRLSNVNNFTAGTVFNRLTYSGAGYSASGNTIDLNAGITVSHGTGITVLGMPLALVSNQTFNVTQAGASLLLTGTVGIGGQTLVFDGAGQVLALKNMTSGAFVPPFLLRGAIHKQGTGSLRIGADMTYSAPTTVNAGNLFVESSLSNSLVTVNAGGAVRGGGTMNTLIVNSGGTVSPGDTGPASLETLGDATLNAGSTFVVRLNGNTAGANYDQLRVHGTVTLGGTLSVSAGFVAAVGDTFTIIQNDGTNAVVGFFDGLPAGSIIMVNARPFRITYGNPFGGIIGHVSNDVVLEAAPGLSIWDGGGGLNQSWSEPLNWVGDVLPMPGDDIQFANPGNGTLTTINDFPAGSAFGSIIFAGGKIQVNGVVAAFSGSIQMTQPSDVDITMPMTLVRGFHLTQPGRLTLDGAVTLTANQLFWTENANDLVYLNGTLDLGANNLTIRNAAGVALANDIKGSGSLSKEGAGELEIASQGAVPAVNVPLTTVNGGTLNQYAHFYGKVVVNPGARLEGGDYSAGVLADVDVHGGTFAPSIGSHVAGTLRMLDGATLEMFIVNQGANGIFGSYVTVDQPVQLTDCNLSVSISPNTSISLGRVFPAILRFSVGSSAIGTFNQLPEGGRFIVEGHSLSVTYQGGSQGTEVDIIVGAPFVWAGVKGDSRWTTASNWIADVAPLPGSDLLFGVNGFNRKAMNDFAPDTSFSSLTFGAPSYVVSGNSLRLAGGLFNEVISGDTIISNDFTASGSAFPIDVSGSSRLLLEGALTGNATCQKTGAGTLQLGGTAPNNFYQMQVWGGNLELAKAPGVNAISTWLTIGDKTNAAVVTILNDHQIGDTAYVSVNAPAVLNLNGNVDSIMQLTGDGTIGLSAGLFNAGRLTVQQGSFSGTIQGFRGGLTKVGITRLELSGINTFNGLTILAGGELRIQGTETNSEIRLDGGVLTGQGWVGRITGNLGGAVNPGVGDAAFQNALHSLDVALNPATTFHAKLTSHDPGYENHKLQVTGAVNLGGAALELELTFVPTPGESFVIIDNDGTDLVTGTFAGLPEGSVFSAPSPNLTWQITYAGGDGNDVVLTLVGIDFRATLAAPTFQPLVGGGLFVNLTAKGVPQELYDLFTSVDLRTWTKYSSAYPDANGLLRATVFQVPPLPMQFYEFKAH